MTGPHEHRAEAERGLALTYAAIQAFEDCDAPAVRAALQGIAGLGAQAVYASLCMLAETAAEAIPTPPPGARIVPALARGPRLERVEIDSEPAYAFAVRLLAASVTGDEPLKLDLWFAFAARERADEVAAVLVILVQLAANARHAGRHQGAAPHAAHRTGHGRTYRADHARVDRGIGTSPAGPGIEPWHLLEALVVEDGKALVLHPSGSCPVACVDEPGCLTYRVFARHNVQVGLGRFRIRARLLPMGGTVLDVEPEGGELD